MRRSRNPAISLFLGCLAFFFAGNGLASLLMFGEIPMMMLYPAFMGMIGGQIALHSIWCVFAPLHWAKRFFVGTTSAILLYMGIFVPSLVPDRIRHADVADLAAPLLCLPLFLLAAQTPLWIMRMWFRWRIVHRDDAASGQFEPLRIGGLLLATAVIGMALAAARLSQSIGSSSGNDSIVWLVVAALVIMVISGITVLPAILAGLYARRLPLALGLALAPDAAIVVVYVALAVTLGGGRFEWELFIVMPVFAGGYFVTLTAPMLIARRLGYRLLWGRG
mgnify:CR=1 FL=1